jgi:hypothetical protein
VRLRQLTLRLGPKKDDLFDDMNRRNNPVLMVIGGDEDAYVWVGHERGPCLGYLDGADVKKLRDRLNAVLASVDGNSSGAGSETK